MITGARPGTYLPPIELTPPPDWNIKNNNLLPLIGPAELPEPPEKFSAESLAIIEDFLADNAKALQLLHQAALLGRAHYPIDLSQGVHTILPPLHDIRHASFLLALQTLAYIEKNKPMMPQNPSSPIFELLHPLMTPPYSLYSSLKCLVKT
jgi:hypothetical protein